MIHEAKLLLGRRLGLRGLGEAVSLTAIRINESRPLMSSMTSAPWWRQS